MPRCQRAKIAGGTFFFTVAIADRSDDLLGREVDRLRDVYREVKSRHLFETIAIDLLRRMEEESALAALSEDNTTCCSCCSTEETGRW